MMVDVHAQSQVKIEEALDELDEPEKTVILNVNEDEFYTLEKLDEMHKSMV